ncbi:outer membrane beta-barrel protein [Pseudoalteromonas denitrificans]|uniref:Outer membrane protein beta-barrel domain-containing protein n=1 Tax=Pseudoalteromonas denitrificans DSM 6059 TaxID=1123010 RepID=A0A1I1RFB1_9GAMM|nr:outer membrane beta-barrel protein [Pseudoalteromonas denitrificans]SFD32999.1 Outer membrane protein beta-barrel domain-containing protein [Pseudoalteromonas denitrificans DSM 6059]
MNKTISLLFLACASMPSFADSTYIGLDYVFSEIKFSDEKAKPSMTSFRLGTTVYKQISVEAQYSISNKSDNIYNMEFDLENSKALFLLLQSTAVNGFSLDVSLGYASSELTVTGPENTFNGTDDYNGFAWGVSFYQQIPSFENAQVKLGYQSLYNDHDISINGITLGFNYHF